MIRNRKIKCIFFILACAFIDKQAFAVPDTRLWLPKKFIELKPRLKNMAELVDQREECASVIRGELALSRSKPGRPVFRIVCRNQESLSFAIYSYVDENSGEDKLDIEEPSEEEEEVIKPIDEVIGRRLCYIAAKDKVSSLVNPEVIIDPDLKPYTNDLNESYFYINVDAQNLSATPLKFGVICTIQPDGAYEMSLMMRSKMETLRIQQQESTATNKPEEAASTQMVNTASTEKTTVKQSKGVIKKKPPETMPASIGKAKVQPLEPAPKIKSRLESEKSNSFSRSGWEEFEAGKQSLSELKNSQITQPDKAAQPKIPTAEKTKKTPEISGGWEVLDNTSGSSREAAQNNQTAFQKNGWQQETNSAVKLSKKAASEEPKTTADGWIIEAK